MTWPQLVVKVMSLRCLTVIFPLRSFHLPSCGLKVIREGGSREQEDDNQCMGQTSEDLGSASLGNLALRRQKGSCRLSPFILLCLWVGMSSCWEDLGATLGARTRTASRDQWGVATQPPVSGRNCRGYQKDF